MSDAGSTVEVDQSSVLRVAGRNSMERYRVRKRRQRVPA